MNDNMAFLVVDGMDGMRRIPTNSLTQMGSKKVVCRRTKANPASADIPVIFRTAMGDTTDVTKAFAIGAVDLVTKPADPSIPRARIDTRLKLRRSFAERQRSRVALIEQNPVLQDNLRLRHEVERIARHDMNSPVAGVIHFSSSLLSDDQVCRDHKEVVQYTEQAACSVLNMVNPWLDLSHLRERIVREAASELSSRQLTAQFLTDGKAAERPAPLTVYGDEVLCCSLFGNLFRNAVEAASPATAIQLDLQPGEEAVTIAMTNDGEAPPDIRANFFDRFSTSGKPGATGLAEKTR